ncbi:MAG TPA: radical SAM protein [Candidatus Moranbacteria bacterium]|nr:radical SAM protein [Candidatus Moranbacteria bacterium]
MENEKIQSPQKKDYDKIAMWLINMECNFHCPYCFYDDSQRSMKTRLGDWVRKKVPAINPYKTRFITPDEISRFFDGIGKRWWIMISGGEPFVYPKFVDIVEKLSQNHLITIGTNLSLPIDEFIKKVSPKNIWSFYISMHLGERERQCLSVDELLEKVKKLRAAGFRTEINYVMYPPLIPRFKEVYEKFEKEGFKLEAKVFRGQYDGKSYPQNYTAQERKIFYDSIPSEIDRAASFENLSFLGVPCSAGNKLIRINPNGSITRCPHDHENLGNIFQNKMNLHDRIKKCVVPHCKCTLAIKEGCVDFMKRK